MVSLGQVHLVLALAAIVAGAGVVGMKKGTGVHRLVGFVYASTMFGVLGSAMLIYNLTGDFGPFHVLALVSLVTIISGVVPVLLRRPRGGWIELHAYFMSWSYVGLLAAAASETLTRVPETPFWWGVVAASTVVVSVGAWFIYRNVPRILRTEFPNYRNPSRT